MTAVVVVVVVVDIVVDIVVVVVVVDVHNPGRRVWVGLDVKVKVLQRDVGAVHEQQVLHRR